MRDTSNEDTPFFTDPSSVERMRHLDRDHVPAHTAVIMDGNGRWASARRLPRIAGHKAGAKAVREVILASIELGIRYLTLYSFSSENWNRSDEEVSNLMRLFVEVLQQELVNLEQMDVRIRLIGRETGIPKTTLRAFRSAEARTARNTTLDLLIALNYGGRSEIVDAVRQIVGAVMDGDLEPGAIAEDDISSRLYTADVPDPDLVIRTSGEMRVSNFLLWQIAYSELWVTDTLWPDFDRNDLIEAIYDYQQRARRFGV